MNALVAMVWKDLILHFSNRRALIMSLAAPILIAAFFGAILGPGDKKPSRIPVAVVNQDDSDVTAKVVAGLKGDSSLDVRDLDAVQALDQVKTGKLRAAVIIPKGFGDQAARALFGPGERPTITVHYDPSQAIVLSIVKGLLAQHIMQNVTATMMGGSGAQGAKLLADMRQEVRKELLSLLDNVQRLNERNAAKNAEAAKGGEAAKSTSGGGMRTPFVTKEEEATSNKLVKYNGYSHAFAGMGVQFILFMGIDLGVGILLMRRLGLWKRLRAAPLSRAMLLGSRIAGGAIIAFTLLMLIFAAGIAFFNVRIEGSIPGFVLVGAAFAVLTATFGLLIAAIGKTPEATRGLAIFVTLILVMLGGAWVPSFVFPEWLQTASFVAPTRWAIDGLEAMTWRGLGFETAALHSAAMLGFSALFALIAIWRFEWEE
jgi:ABC-2 type transport system permease protein